jgi:GTP cyclohydrolase II
VMAAETVMQEGMTGNAPRLPRGTQLLLTGQRLQSLGIAAEPHMVYSLSLPEQAAPALIGLLADPTSPQSEVVTGLVRAARPADGDATAAIELCKLAGLLPAAVTHAEGRLGGGEADEAALVSAAAIENYRRLASESLRPVSEARVPLADAENARVVAFRPTDGGPEQYAILIGEPERHAAPLARLHSECFTGDFLGSLRCDCGDQLRGAIRRMAHEGAGVLLYLAQEGRGIGLTNKLRAYMLQDAGLDTVDANHHLGFDNDERDFWAAAAMLRQLGIERVRLLTNNPSTIAQLEQYGIAVAGRVPHIFEANAHNRDYLLTKAHKSGHMLTADDLDRPSNGAGKRLNVI